MCGICGYYQGEGEELLVTMCELMRHRGPDDQGIYTAPRIGLGMTRLAIVDVAGGHQPMSNEDGRVWVVFNGEIYNFRELRENLVARGHVFHSRADTEVIAHLYEDLGVACVQRLRGIFAFAVWDGETLFVARDRLGVKPLYYTWVRGRFYFASEIKALLACPGVVREVDEDALDDYMTFQYVAGPRTMFRRIFKLAPGYWLKVNGRGAWMDRYWTLPTPSPRAVSTAAAEERVRALVDEAVRLRTLADVPLGALLSGGLDSSLVVAFLQRTLEQPVKAFHIRFQGEEGEASYARGVAERLGCEYYELTARPADLRALPEVIWHLDEPIADAAAWATYLICKYAKQHVTVLLTGEGGDEVFGGYPRYYLSAAADWFHRMPAAFRRAALAVIAAWPAARGWRRRVEKIITSRDETWARNLEWLSIFDDDARRKVYAPDFQRRLAGGRAAALYQGYFRSYDAARNIQRLTAADVKTWLADNVLMKVDKASMAAGVEARVPLLDHVLVEYVFRLRTGPRFGGRWPKGLLKKVGQGVVPDFVLRRPKRAFEVPVAKWLREYERDWVCDVLLDPHALARGFFRRETLSALVQDYLVRGFGGRRVWNLFCLELWFREFIDGQPTARRARTGASHEISRINA